jgi:hypothetical protein
VCYVTGMRTVLVLGVALLLGGCVYNPYTGLWQPAGYYGYYGYGYRPYYPPPPLWLFPVLRLLWLSVWRLPPRQLFAASQWLSGVSATFWADAKRATPNAAGTATRGAATAF